MKALIRKLLPKPLLESLQKRRVQKHLANFPGRIVEHRYGDHRRRVTIEDRTGEAWYDRDMELPPEYELLKRSSLKPGARVFDIGAHQGVVAMMLAGIVEDHGHVVGVEASPHNARCAAKNVELNAISHIEIENKAIADQSGNTIPFSLNFNASVTTPGSRFSQDVETITIDDLVTQHGKPDLVVIDVEGYECHALKGAPATLKTGPDWSIEVHVNHGLEEHGSVNELVSYFPPDRYELLHAIPDSEDFVPFAADSPIVQDRFFLLARARSA